MNRWDRFSHFHQGPKAPPPPDGIKIKKAGTTWWGERWIEALQNVLRGDAGRLTRGKTYARAGRTHDLEITQGKVTAKVTGSRPTPYQVSLELPVLDAKAWTRVIEALATKAQFCAELLAGRMPQSIDEVFATTGVSLFPRERSELVTSCTCPDWGDPCKHVAAMHFVLGEALDRDPFLLFELRGRGKEQVLEALRQARAGGKRPKKKPSSARSKENDTSPPEAIPSITLSALTPAEYDASSRELPLLQFSFDPPAVQGALLEQLGTPPAWDAPADALAPILRRAASAARAIALAHGDTEETATHPTEVSDAPAPQHTAPPKTAKRRKPEPKTAKRRK